VIGQFFIIYKQIIEPHIKMKKQNVVKQKSMGAFKLVKQLACSPSGWTWLVLMDLTNCIKSLGEQASFIRLEHDYYY